VEGGERTKLPFPNFSFTARLTAANRLNRFALTVCTADHFRGGVPDALQSIAAGRSLRPRGSGLRTIPEDALLSSDDSTLNERLDPRESDF